MIVVGLTGGIGSGKSTVAAALVERGAVLIDADAIVRELQQPGTPLLTAIAERFGSGIVGADGALDRAALAAVVFSDREALGALNALVHPAVVAEIDSRLGAHRGTDHVVVVDIPLLRDKRRHGMTGVLVVDVPVETAVARLVAQRGLSEADARARVANQISREERLALADHVIDNGGDLEALAAEVDAAWAWIVTQPPADGG
jgi:dephospho-CoA kinase